MKATPILASAIVLLAATHAAAQTVTGPSIGVEVVDYGYRERDGGQMIVFDDGVMAGLDFGYTARIATDLFVSARVAGRHGRIDYRSDDGDRLDDIDQSVGQLDLRLVADLPLKPGTTFSPFVGLGHRLLIDESGGAVAASGARGYDREISYSYLPFGATLAFGYTPRSSFAISAEYDVILGGRFESNFSDVDADLPDVAIKGNGGHGIQIAATLTRPVGRHALAIGPFLRHWRVDRSQTLVITEPEGSARFYEPQNRTTEWGLRIGFTF